MSETKITPAAAIATLMERGRKIEEALRSEDPKVREIAFIALELIECVEVLAPQAVMLQEGK